MIEDLDSEKALEQMKNENPKLAKIRNWFSSQWWRYLSCSPFINAINFVLLAISLSAHTRAFINETFGILVGFNMAIVVVPVGIFGILFLGYFLEKVMHQPQRHSIEGVKRDPSWQLIFKNFRDLQAKADKMQAQLDRIEKQKGETKI